MVGKRVDARHLGQMRTSRLEKSWLSLNLLEVIYKTTLDVYDHCEDIDLGLKLLGAKRIRHDGAVGFPQR